MVLHFLKVNYEKVKGALSKTRSFFSQKLQKLFGKGINPETLDSLEQILYEADLGSSLAATLTKKVEEAYSKNSKISSNEILQLIQNEILAILKQSSVALTPIPQPDGPAIILIVGVNGNGKTTSLAKLAKRFKREGKKVLIAAADTFRAAAIDQLEIWAKKLEIELVKGKPGSDPAAIVFDALTAAKAREIDLVLIDTAGRLHTKTPLMQELEKIKRSCKKVIPQAPNEVLLVLDAVTGQNAIDQAKTFHQFTPITGIILTKLDGTAKGGLAINIQNQLKIPVKFIGTGEGEDDLQPFNPESFTSALFE